MKMIKAIILANEVEGDHEFWVKACELNNNISYKVVNLTSSDWLEQILKVKADILFTKPSGYTSLFKELYDERLMILSEELKYIVYPSLSETLIYENKRYLSFFLKANKIRSPLTSVFYTIEEARRFISTTKYPIVGKMNIGASGKGITILKSSKDALFYTQTAFGNGLKLKVGPNLKKGNLLSRLWKKISHPSELINRIKIYKTLSLEVQKGYCIFQEYISHNYEWRVVRIGDSFFAHKKMVKKQMASGTLLKQYDNPPFALLSFVKNITDKHLFRSMALDIFEPNVGEYYVNEMQCIFGQSDQYQMLVDGKPGRYIYNDDNWIFEEGMFNTNKSYDLRLEFALELVGNKTNN